MASEIFFDMFDTCQYDIVTMYIQKTRGEEEKVPTCLFDDKETRARKEREQGEIDDMICRDPRRRIDAILKMIDNVYDATHTLPKPFATIELLLCEFMHQISMCISKDGDRAMFIHGFRGMFAKQVFIATTVVGPAISRKEWDESMDGVVKAFARYGCVPAIDRVPADMALYIDEVCRNTDPKVWGGRESDERCTTTSEVAACLGYLSSWCDFMSQGSMDTSCSGAEPVHDPLTPPLLASSSTSKTIYERRKGVQWVG